LSHAWFVFAGFMACGTPGEPAAPAPAVAAHPSDALAALDARAPVPLLPHMALHQKQNMQDHLLVVQQITDGLARSDWTAVEAAAGRFASSPQMQMQCEHMGMGADGFTERALDFHRRADGIVAAAKEQDASKVLAATAATLEACTGCHATYRQDVVTDDAWRERTGATAPAAHL
jgi:Cytochrome C'